MRVCAKSCHACLSQVVMGRDYPENVVNHPGELYGTWASGLLGWPYIDLPFTRFGKAQRAKQELLDWFQVRGAVAVVEAGHSSGLLVVLVSQSCTTLCLQGLLEKLAIAVLAAAAIVSPLVPASCTASCCYTTVVEASSKLA
eukprot:GHUV01037700.1.p1 GENE.GHUV01037700.1~~GHUV01037700.1.p1  ORF type:complete len:142 (-),score=25.55 GHUV01037700.1:227-652(-)